MSLRVGSRVGEQKKLFAQKKTKKNKRVFKQNARLVECPIWKMRCLVMEYYVGIYYILKCKVSFYVNFNIIIENGGT